MLKQHLLLFILWVVYCVLHSALAAAGFKNKLKNKLGDRYRYYRIFYTLFAFITLLLLAFFQVKMNSPILFSPGTILLVAATIVSLTGLIIMIVCIKKYFLSLSGLQSLYKEQPGPKLIIKGLHRYVRHPLYLGTFIFIWGIFFIWPYFSLLIADVVITAYTVIAIKFEEKKLVEEFGEEYLAYQKTVPKLIPWAKTPVN